MAHWWRRRTNQTDYSSVKVTQINTCYYLLQNIATFSSITGNIVYNIKLQQTYLTLKFSISKYNQ